MFTRQFVRLLALAAAAVPLGLAAPAPAFGGVDVRTAGKNLIADKYIVVFKNDVEEGSIAAHTEEVKTFHQRSGARLTGAKGKGVEKSFNLRGFKGYSGGFDTETLKEIAKSPLVDYIEADAVFTTQTTQSGSTYGLDRISHKSYSAPYTYEYDGTTAGSGVTVYVVDTGVYIGHSEFEGRATWGYNAVDSSNSDGNGHGTHCAGTIGGKTYGVAKKVKIVAVKVLSASGSGSTSGILDGLNWVAQSATSGKSVVSMSLGGSYSQSLNNVVDTLYSAGIVTVVAAGNDGANAANTSPASAARAITVGAIDSSTTRASFSNYGAVLDVFAPGVNVLSSWIGGSTATNTISGTSMACPHVAGLSAYLISQSGSLTPGALATKLTGLALTGLISNPGSGSPNRVAYNGYA